VEAPAAPVVEAPVPPPAAPIVVQAPAAFAVPVEAAPAPAPAAKVEPLAVVTPGGTKVQIYGRLELNSAYEDGIGEGLWTQIAPKNANKDAQGRTTLSIARTRLGLNLTGPSKEGEPELNGRFEADFAGRANYENFSGGASSSMGNIGFRVRQSYGAVKYKDLGLTILFGQTDDLFSPLDPPSINPSSLNGAGNIGNRRPQIRLTQALGPTELAIAATQDRLTDDTKAPSSPGVQARLGAKIPATWAGEKANMALGVAGHYAKNEAANADDEKRAVRPPESYSFNVDLSLPLVDILTLTGEFFTGQNLRRYSDGSLGLSPPASATKDSSQVQSIGWWGALAAKLPASFGAAAGVGMESLDDDSRQKDKPENSMFIFANVSYNFTSAAKLTFEYLNLASDWTEEKDGKLKTSDDKGHLNRFELNFRYDFK
jgi:hypothetical protein